MKALIAELLGTSWLVLGGCGAAVLAAANTHSWATAQSPFWMAPIVGALLGAAAYGVIGRDDGEAA